MTTWINLSGPIIADTVYSSGVLVAKDVAVSLPAVNPITTDYRAMGTMSLPIAGQIESMEMTITKVGVDMGLGRLLFVKSNILEFRWVQDVIKADGTSGPQGCKAFIRSISKNLPGLSIEPGNPSENDLIYEALRYQLFVGGAELWLIDRLSQIYRIMGVDYYREIQSLL